MHAKPRQLVKLFQKNSRKRRNLRCRSLKNCVRDQRHTKHVVPKIDPFWTRVQFPPPPPSFPDPRILSGVSLFQGGCFCCIHAGNLFRVSRSHCASLFSFSFLHAAPGPGADLVWSGGSDRSDPPLGNRLSCLASARLPVSVPFHFDGLNVDPRSVWGDPPGHLIR